QGNLDAVGSFYSPDAVLIHKGTSCAYGREGKIPPFLFSICQKCLNTISEEVTEATSDHIVYKSVFKTKAKGFLGVVGGKSVQIFRKEGNQWLIILDEFEG
ncbi:hypothetical protein PMAYCL1PPCAC_13263, partial [Pristionchus mayeri]